jgi:hypothetical protein
MGCENTGSVRHTDPLAAMRPELLLIARRTKEKPPRGVAYFIENVQGSVSIAGRICEGGCE